LSVSTENEDSVFIDKEINIRDNCYAFGFPNNDEENEAKAIGLESDKDGMTFEVVFDDAKTVKFKGEQFKEGFSGSPILNEVTGAICSIITISRDTDEIKGGYGISLEKLSEFSGLKYNNVDDIKNWKSDKQTLLQSQEEELNKLVIINTQTYIEKLNNYDNGNINLYSCEQLKEKDIVDKNDLNIKQSHIIPRDGYIEPRLVEIKELGIHVAVCPVTFEEYDLFCEDMKLNPPQSYQFQFPREDYPVINVNWNDAVKYCEWLNSKTNQFKYRLPFSEEWDKIAKLNYIDIDKIDNYICHKGNKITTLQRIATKKAGDLGIFDMYGNINEWCDDNYDEKNKIIKGESFNHYFENLDIEINYCLQNESKKLLGFRMIANKIT